MSAPLARSFFARPTETVARDLLGTWLLRAGDEGLSGGRVVETEAYGGPEDLASHARAGRTKRTSPMFGPVGHAYVYLTYGMHDCMNVVAYAGREAGAVLIRAIKPLVGIDEIRRRRARPNDPDVRLCAGPARLCQALLIDRSFSGHDLTVGDRLWLAAPHDGEGDPAADPLIESGPRIGVGYALDGWSDRRWRFWLARNAAVSRVR